MAELKLLQKSGGLDQEGQDELRLLSFRVFRRYVLAFLRNRIARAFPGMTWRQVYEARSDWPVVLAEVVKDVVRVLYRTTLNTTHLDETNQMAMPQEHLDPMFDYKGFYFGKRCSPSLFENVFAVSFAAGKDPIADKFL